MPETNPAIFVLGENVFRLTGAIGVEKDRSPVFVNVDLIGGVAGDTNGIGFLSQHVEGIISTNRHVIEMSNSAGLITIQRLFAPDLGTIERGLKLVKRAKPHCVEVLPTLTYPVLAGRHPEVLERPVLAGGLIKSPEEITLILEAGAIGVSTSFEALWKGA